MVLLLIVVLTPAVCELRIPLKPAPVPVPPLLIVIVPILLLLMTSPLWKLKSKMPAKPQLLLVIVVSLTTIPDEPSRLPTVLPLVPPILNEPPTEPTEIPIKADPVVVAPVLVVCVKPEIVLPWIPVTTVVLVLVACIPFIVFDEPLI